MRLKQKNLKLPADVIDHFDLLGQDDRNVYMKALRDAQWTLQSLADAAEISRERVRQIVGQDWPQGELDPDAPLPTPPAAAEPFRNPRVQTEPNPETLARLKELQPIARKVAGNSTKYRAEAEEYAALLWQAKDVEHVTYYHLAQLLGVTHSAIRSKLVRYGYIEPMTSTTPSRAYRRVKTDNRVRSTNMR